MDSEQDSYVTEYLAKQQEYEALYGPMTVVFTQAGNFYHCMEYNPQDCINERDKRDNNNKLWSDHIGKVTELFEICECVQTSRNKQKPHSVSNPWSFGFNINSFDKFAKRALRVGYIVVRIEQQTDSITKKISRVVTEVINPSTILETTSHIITKNISVIYIEYQPVRGHKHYNRPQNFLVTAGASSIDLITGKSTVADFYNHKDNKGICIERLYYFLITEQPRELIVYLNEFPENLIDDYKAYIEMCLELRRYERVVIHANNVNAEYQKVAYQIQFFNTLFTQKSAKKVLQLRKDRIIEHIGLEHLENGRLAYILLMNHQIYNAAITTKPSIPTTLWLNENSQLLLSHNALVQLNIIPLLQDRIVKSKGIDSLFSVMDKNCTNLGRRLLRNLLVAPMVNSAEINLYYEMIDEVHTCNVNDVPLYLYLDRKLKELPDIESLARKIQNKLISPRELSIFYMAFKVIVRICRAIKKSNAETLMESTITTETICQLKDYLSHYGSILDIECLSECSILKVDKSNKIMEFKEFPFIKGNFCDLDKQYKRLIRAESKLAEIAEHLNTFLNIKGREKPLTISRVKRKVGSSAIEESTALIITATPAKSNKLVNANYSKKLCGTLRADAHNASEKLITSDVMDILYDDIATLKRELRKTVYQMYISILDEMNTTCLLYSQVCSSIAKLDLIHSYGKISKLYNYNRPVIYEEEKGSYFEAVDMRHPIVERIITGEFVSNDVYLGASSNNPKASGGLIIKGQNSSGKTTLAKSAVINIIMAQCGCYVPSYLKFKPYNKIFTRLSTCDNIFRNESSFMVEISELITMMKQVDSNSLCVLDEITRGSDFMSAVSITASAINSLVEAKSSFILATHIHNLYSIPIINKMGKKDLNICHLSLTRDEETNLLVYNRKLKEGDGTSCYGIMVAESMGMPAPFITKSYEVLKHIQGNDDGAILGTKKSNYNSGIYKKECIMCKSKTNLHSHHIKPQSLANDNKLIGSLHMNAKDNIAFLCEKCHIGEVHRNKVALESVDSLNGKAIVIKK